MPYVLRNEAGKIVRASMKMLPGSEMVSHSHPEITEFLKARGQDPGQIDNSLNELRRTDVEMARAVEDVIMVLLKKNILKMTDMPKVVQDRMNLRVKLRVLIQDMYEQASEHKPQ